MKRSYEYNAQTYDPWWYGAYGKVTVTVTAMRVTMSVTMNATRVSDGGCVSRKKRSHAR